MGKNKNKRAGLNLGINNSLKGINLGTSSSNKVLPTKETVKALAKDFAFIPIEQIERNSDQPRIDFNATDLNDLQHSIKTHGLIQPITVRRMAEGQYQLISGERRWRASKLAGLTEIPAFIRIAGDAEMMEMALIENTHRADLNPIEIATTFVRLKKEFNYSDEQLAERVESSRSKVTNYRRLLELPEEVQLALKERKISTGHARTILGIDDYAGRVALLNTVIEEGLSVRALEKLVRSLKEPKVPSAPKKSRLPDEYIDVQNRLSHHLGSKIQLKRDPKTGKGSVVINFADDTDLNRLIELLEGND